MLGSGAITLSGFCTFSSNGFSNVTFAVLSSKIIYIKFRDELS